jgi:DNA-binding CsgD family transcriptional regulator
MIAEGMTEREIAAKEFISYNSAKFRTKVIRRKLSVRSNAAAVGIALQEGLIRA